METDAFDQKCGGGSEFITQIEKITINGIFATS
jgi:hypothetical protein